MRRPRQHQQPYQPFKTLSLKAFFEDVAFFEYVPTFYPSLFFLLYFVLEDECRLSALVVWS